MTNKAYAVPLHELLAGVPRDTRLEITDPDGYGTRFIPVGRYCHEAAEALRAAIAQPEPIAVWELQEGGWDTIADADWMESLPVGTKLYTAQPKKKWVGLTDEEKSRIDAKAIGIRSAMYLTEVILKEKNK